MGLARKCVPRLGWPVHRVGVGGGYSILFNLGFQVGFPFLGWPVIGSRILFFPDWVFPIGGLFPPWAWAVPQPSRKGGFLGTCGPFSSFKRGFTPEHKAGIWVFPFGFSSRGRGPRFFSHLGGPFYFGPLPVLVGARGFGPHFGPGILGSQSPWPGGFLIGARDPGWGAPLREEFPGLTRSAV